MNKIERNIKLNNLKISISDEERKKIWNALSDENKEKFQKAQNELASTPSNPDNPDYHLGIVHGKMMILCELIEKF